MTETMEECESCGKDVLKKDLAYDFMGEMSCSACRAVHAHIGLDRARFPHKEIRQVMPKPSPRVLQ